MKKNKKANTPVSTLVSLSAADLASVRGGTERATTEEEETAAIGALKTLGTSQTTSR